MRPVDADIIIQNLTGMKNYYDAIALDGMIKALKEAPTIEAAPVVHGEWILEREPDGTPYCYHCSVCDSDFMRINIKTVFPYCPNCGAKMDGKAV